MYGWQRPRRSRPSPIPPECWSRRSKWKGGSARDYNGAAQTCGANADAVSKQLFERLVGDEEGHQNEFERV
jgi:bacterioferritin